jgi:hypothetical protein
MICPEMCLQVRNEHSTTDQHLVSKHTHIPDPAPPLPAHTRLAHTALYPLRIVPWSLLEAWKRPSLFLSAVLLPRCTRGPSGELNGYATRELSGHIADYHWRRWQLFVQGACFGPYQVVNYGTHTHSQHSDG